MSIPLDIVDKSGRTFLDFWRLRPRRFLTALAAEPNQYLSPLGFLSVSLGVVFSLLLVASGLSAAGKSLPSGRLDPKLLVTRVLVFLIVWLLIGTMLNRVLLTVWPIRGKTTFRPLFDFQSYVIAAVVLPGAAVDVLIAELPVVRTVLGSILGLLVTVFYVMPGFAHLAGVPTRRVWLGTVFWSAVLGLLMFIGGIVLFGVLG